MDFFRVATIETKEKGVEIYPDFIVGRSKDLMIQGRTFYAVWDEAEQLWSRDEYDVQRLVDEELQKEADAVFARSQIKPTVKYMRSFNSNSWAKFRKFVQNISDNYQQLDAKLIFANTEVKKSDYASKRLPYNLEPGEVTAWDELLGTLYSVEERKKIEWAIGSIVCGDSKKIQKFLVFYGPPGTGKSTILTLIQTLFDGYTTAFDGKALGSSNSAFATEVFKHNPLVAIQHDGDLSRLEDNARLNSIVAHEDMTMNEKYKPSYTSRVLAMLFMGSNQPVRISDAKSGIIRRLIDVHPTGVKIPAKNYQALMSQIQFELGAIAYHCMEVYQQMGKNYYSGYRPLEMMLQTDVFFNYIEAHYDVFKGQEFTTLRQAYDLYTEYCQETGIDRPLPQYKMREELRNYFEEFHERYETEEGMSHRSVYTGFTAEKFKTPAKDALTFKLVLNKRTSLLDDELASMPAQLAKEDGTPAKKWGSVTTTLADINSHDLHYVKVPKNHVVIDFDLKDINGTKALDRNLEAASLWPATYAEVSKSGAGVHLHYNYSGDVRRLASDYADGIEVKVYAGDASLRRRLSRCNGIPVATISSGLPLKDKESKVLTDKQIKSEQSLRKLVERNLRKEIHPGTKPSIDFIKKILDDAYASDLEYDLTDLRGPLISFAANSSNQSEVALKVVKQMKFASEKEVEASPELENNEGKIAFFDVEVYSNLFIICWKFEGADEVVQMVNPSAEEVAALFKLKLVGFYNRRYDNHIIYAASMGYAREQLYALSQRLVSGEDRKAAFGAAYNLSYADIWDFSSIKQSLKKFEIQLGILHLELDIPWDQPVPEDQIPRVLEYCVNDVRATEAVFNDRKEDFVARQILAELSGLSVNDTTQKHTAKILFGNDKNPQDKFIYTNLADTFPGYEFSFGKSSYKGEDPGEGGYVYAEPGIYENVALLDVASMHPASMESLNIFGDEYTKRFSDLKAARLAIKRQDYDKARSLLGGRLGPFLVDAEDNVRGSEALAYALKIVINIVYGLTSAKFDNPFKDRRNKDNIVAKRGALFMIDLKEEIQKRGYTVAHIKTDSIKIPNADREIIEFVMDFGEKYGYEFEHEATYEKFALVNDAVYVARNDGKWTATGAQFQHPYVFKTLFSGEELGFDDFCESKSVNQGAMYLDLSKDDDGEHDYTRMRFLGKTGRFVPVLEGGGVLWRVKDDKYFAVSGTKGHYWVDATVAKSQDPNDLSIDMSYFNKLKEKAVSTIEKFGISFEQFKEG